MESTKCIVKGITLNYTNSQTVHFSSVKHTILKDSTPLHVHNPKKIKYKHGGVVISEPETKEHKIVLKNRRRWLSSGL
jgi:hypothetical protein